MRVELMIVRCIGSLTKRLIYLHHCTPPKNDTHALPAHCHFSNNSTTFRELFVKFAKKMKTLHHIVTVICYQFQGLYKGVVYGVRVQSVTADGMMSVLSIPARTRTFGRTTTTVLCML